MKTIEELGTTLNEMYTNAPKKRQVAMVHLFAIQHCSDIKRLGTREVVEASGISTKYQAEINKGLNLADYVTVK